MECAKDRSERPEDFLENLKIPGMLGYSSSLTSNPASPLSVSIRTLNLSLVVSFILAIALSFSADLHADTAVLRPSRDNTIFSENNGASNGVGNILRIGRIRRAPARFRRGLFAFSMDPSEIPDGAIIDNVTFSLRLIRSPSRPGGDFSLHKLTNDWGEGTSNPASNRIGRSEGRGATAQTDDATWSQTFFDSQSWNSEGGDFEVGPSATANVGVGTTSWTSAELAADVQEWLDNPGSNFGWILIGPENTHSVKHFHSREATNMDDRPMLTVEFTAVGFVDPFEGVNLEGGFLFSEWYGIYNPIFFPWVFHVNHGWQFVFPIEVGEVFLFDLICQDFWWTTSAFLSLTLYSIDLNDFIFYFRDTASPRQFVNLSTGEFFTKPGPDP